MGINEFGYHVLAIHLAEEAAEKSIRMRFKWQMNSCLCGFEVLTDRGQPRVAVLPEFFAACEAE
jgi:hypothetical protein